MWILSHKYKGKISKLIKELRNIKDQGKELPPIALVYKFAQE